MQPERKPRESCNTRFAFEIVRRGAVNIRKVNAGDAVHHMLVCALHRGLERAKESSSSTTGKILYREGEENESGEQLEKISRFGISPCSCLDRLRDPSGFIWKGP